MSTSSEAADGSEETAEAAISRLVKSVRDGVTVEQLSPTSATVAAGGESAVITVDEESRSYRLEGVESIEIEYFGPGGDLPGPPSAESEFSTRNPMHMAAGRGMQFSGSFIVEPATGQLEVEPDTPLTKFLYDEMVLHGWNYKIPGDPGKLFRGMLIFWVVGWIVTILVLLTVLIVFLITRDW